MSDPVSIAVSIAVLIASSANIIEMAKEMFDKVKDAPETVMQVREEVESMQPIFRQVQHLLTGTGSGLNRGNLAMASVHDLRTTLTGCVIVYTRLETKVNEVCGFNDPTTATAGWKRVGVIADRVKWGLWRHEEVLVIIEDLQRQKLNLNLMLSIITCTTTTEASEVQAKLLKLSTGILQLNHAHSVLLHDLISRQAEQAQVLDGQARVLDKQARVLDKQARVLEGILDRSSLGDTDSSMVSTPPSVSSPSSSYCDNCNSDNAPISSMHSDITLRNLSVSQIAVLNPPIELADVSNPEPFKEPSSAETHSHPKSRRIWSSRGRIHNAIESGDECAIRTLLSLGVDIEELDSSSRTPLLHAIEKLHVPICILLLEKGATWEALTSGMTFTELLQLLDPSAVSLHMHDVVNAGNVSLLQLLSLMEARDTEGWTPLASAAFNLNEALCEFLVAKGCTLCLDTEQKKQLKPKLSLRIHNAARHGHKTALQLLLDMGADINERDLDGKTALLSAVSDNHLSCVKILTERGADATISNRSSNVLHYAAWISADIETMKFLLEQVVETRDLVNGTRLTGSTPLHDCSHNRNEDIALEHAKMLVQAGATLTIKNRIGETPYEYARGCRRKKLAKYLWSQISPEQQAQEIPPPPDW